MKSLATSWRRYHRNFESVSASSRSDRGIVTYETETSDTDEYSEYLSPVITSFDEEESEDHASLQ